MGQFPERVARNIKKYRKEQNLTLKEMAERVGISEATMQEYEAGNIKSVTIDMLHNIANALNVSPEDLTEWEKGEYEAYRKQRHNDEESKLLKSYSMLTKGHKKVVRNLIKDLIDCQDK